MLVVKIIILICIIFIIYRIIFKQLTLYFIKSLKNIGYFKYSSIYNINSIARKIMIKKSPYIDSCRNFSYEKLENMEITTINFFKDLDYILNKNDIDTESMKEYRDEYGNIDISIEDFDIEIYKIDEDRGVYIRRLVLLINLLLLGANSIEKVYLIEDTKEIVFLTESLYKKIIKSKIINSIYKPIEIHSDNKKDDEDAI